MSEEAQFEGSEIVTDWFGYWPSLHDSEVLSADFQRAIGGSGPELRVKVHAFEMTSEVNEKGYFKLMSCPVNTGYMCCSQFGHNWNGRDRYGDGATESGVDLERG